MDKQDKKYILHRYSEHGLFVVLDITLLYEKNKKRYILIYKNKKIDQIKRKRVFYADIDKDKNIISVFVKNEQTWKAAIRSATYLHLESVKGQCDVMKKSHYTNGKMLAPDGEILLRCGSRKMQWYLDKNLATKISEDPLVIKLNFEPKGRTKDLFSISEKENKCVICGTTKNLTRHHVVPYCFIRHFKDLKYETYSVVSSHDLLLVCRKHHDEYEKKATFLKEEIGKSLGITLKGCDAKIDEKLIEIRRIAKKMLNKKNKFSKKEIKYNRDLLCSHFNIKRLRKQDIVKASNIDVSNEERIEYGKYVIDNTPNLKNFIIKWRKHFIKYANPKYLPPGWHVNRFLEKSFKKKIEK